jgi:hydroxymethylbilane synthase
MAGKTLRSLHNNGHKTELKLGTRKSLLAWAQSGWVAREIEKANPGIKVELVGIETRGDKVLDISLQNLAQISGGKEFFVAEIDDALRSGAVDLTVHSMKDLSLDRPEEFVLAANPERENPRDVALFSPEILEKLRAGKRIRIGTSSPRRLENIPGFLAKALPQLTVAGPQLEFVDIRGNVNTRLSRVREPAGAPKQLDAVILAFAGLIRLWIDEKGREELRKLLQGVRWMVLPLRECPAAPAQGALAIECRRSDQEVFGQIQKIHSPSTFDHVVLERNLLAQWGGGCHQKFGATAISTSALEKLFYVRGKKPDGEFVDEFHWQTPPRPRGPVQAWDGNEWRAQKENAETATSANIAPNNATTSFSIKAPAVFVTHSRAAKGANFTENSKGKRVWTSGTSSWLRLASQGVWVEGCAEGLGFDVLRRTLQEGVLQLPEFKSWNVLTHSEATEDWKSELPSDQVIAAYQVNPHYSTEAKVALKRSTDVFWSSGSQFNALKTELSTEQLGTIRHACGPGKTSQLLAKELGEKLRKQLLVFPSVEEWKKWIISIRS